jgi:hypothetical protein
LEIISHILEDDGLGLKNETGTTSAAKLIILWLRRYLILNDGQSKFLAFIWIIVLSSQKFDLVRCMLIIPMSRADDPSLHSHFSDLWLRMIHDFKN